MASLWGGRFEKEMDDLVKEFNASIRFDARLFREDIDGSIAHVTMLASCGIVTEEEKQQIIEGLNAIRQEIEDGKIVFSTEDEDIHMAVEKRLTEKIGDVGKKLHTARSRNDQCQTDLRLFVKRAILSMIGELKNLEEVILQKAQENVNEMTIGFTHIQHAQPITIGFLFMAYFQMFKRDIERLYDTLERMDYSPLGSCAMAGTSFPIDRAMTADLLGFIAPTENAMDSVSDRD